MNALRRSLAATAVACLLLTACGIGRAKVDVAASSGAEGSYTLTASKRADYPAILYQQDFLRTSAQLAVDNGYQYFNVDRGEINSSASRSQRTATWQIRLHNDSALAKSSIQTYRAAEVLEYGAREQVLWIKDEQQPDVN